MFNRLNCEVRVPESKAATFFIANTLIQNSLPLYYNYVEKIICYTTIC